MTDLDDTSEAPARPPRSRSEGLGVGPVGLLAITAVALLIAAVVGRAALEALDEDPIDVQEMLDASAKAPLVTDIDARAEIGGPAPNVRLEYLDGDVQDLAEVAGTGTPVVLNFWSSTCIPCLNEMPAFEEVSQELTDEVTFIGVGVTDTEQAGKEMVERTGVTYRNARDPRSEIFAVYGGIALPRTVFIAGDGTIVATHSGELTADELRALLAENDMLPV